MSRERWFANAVKESVGGATTLRQSATYIENLDRTLKEANEAYARTILNKDLTLNQNPNLDGFIAEQHHVQTFNMSATARGSDYSARVNEPNGKAYSKNGVDITIVDTKTQKVVKRYQSKYGKDAKATTGAFEHGDYRGQQKLVPEDQLEDINRKATAQIEAPDGVKSEPLSKQRAKELQQDAQSGNWKHADS